MGVMYRTSFRLPTNSACSLADRYAALAALHSSAATLNRLIIVKYSGRESQEEYGMVLQIFEAITLAVIRFRIIPSIYLYRWYAFH